VNRAAARKLRQLVEALQLEVTSHLSVKYGVRLLPLSIDHLSAKITDALHQAKLVGELHAFDRTDPTPENEDDKTPTNPGFRSKRPPPPPVKK
jgi:hypothetical protein